MDTIKQVLTESAAYAWSEETPYLIGLVAFAGVLLFRFRPLNRATLSNTLLLYLASLAGQFFSGIINSIGFARTAEALHELSIIAGGIAVIRVLGLLLFRILLPLLRAHTPRIVDDILVMAAYIVWGMVRLRHAGMNLGDPWDTQSDMLFALIGAVTALLLFSRLHDHQLQSVPT